MSTLFPELSIDVKTKICTVCKIEKPLTNEFFSPMHKKKNGTRYLNSCKQCGKPGNELIKNYLKNNPIPENYKCPICGSTEDEILEETGAYQDGPKRKLFNVDHDHKTNKVRGVICTYCNNMIARSRDNPEILRNGAKWLEEKNNE